MRKKFLAMFMCILMLLASTSFVFADDNDGSNSLILAGEPRGVVYINQDIYKGTSYEKTFSANKNNGANLNVYVKNDSSVKVTMTVKNLSTGDVFTRELAANGGQFTSPWFNQKGINGTYEVKVDNSTSDRMNIYVHARQF